MLIFWQTPVITKHCFQNIRRTFHKFLFQKYSKDIPGVLQGYENIFMKSKSSKKMLCGLSCENFNIGSLLSCNIFLNCIETVFHLV